MRVSGISHVFRSYPRGFPAICSYNPVRKLAGSTSNTPEPERSPRFLLDGTMPRFWPPRPSRFWAAVLAPVRYFFGRRRWRLTGIDVRGAEQASARIAVGDGVLLAPNHSAEPDGYVMLHAGRKFGRSLFFMAAWQAFLRYRGLAGWAMQHVGGFSVDREGSDRRAMRQAVDVLTGGHSLLVFPEGEVYHLGGRLRPLLEGVAFMALTAHRGMDGRRVWIVPTGIVYRYEGDIRPRLHRDMKLLERRMALTPPPPDTTLADRIVRYGELMLTVKEKEKLGRSREEEGDLPARIRYLIESLLERHEAEYLKSDTNARTIPQRVRVLRRPLLETWTDEGGDPEERRKVRTALDDVQLAMQLYSYPGDYVTENPTPERMAETIEKFEEDIYGFVRPKGARRVKICFGAPIDISQVSGTGRPREVAAEVTDRLTEAIQGLIDREGSG